MKKIFLAAIVVLLTITNASTSNADLFLDFNGGSITQTDGNVIIYTVELNGGTLTGVPLDGVFDANETNNPTILSSFTIDFDQNVDFTVLPTIGPNLGNSGDNEGVSFTTNTGVFDASLVTGATITGDGTDTLTFRRPNGGPTSGSSVDFGSFTVAGTSQIIFQGLGDGSNREAYRFKIADSVAAAVPEPGSVAVLSLGSLALLLRRRR